MYAIPEDLLNAFPKVYTSNFTTGELELFIDRAGQLIDAWLSRRYTVPIASSPATTPGFIRHLCVDLAALDIFDRAASTPDWVVRRVERAQELLKMLAEGTIGIPGIVEDPEIGTIRSTTEDFVPVFGGIPSLNERWDPSRRADEEGERGVDEDDSGS